MVPDDIDMASQSNGEDQNDVSNPMDSDDDDTGSIASVASTIPATVGDFGMNVAENDIMQSCATASMSGSMFHEPSPAVEESDEPITPGNVDAEDEPEFSQRSFNSALFSMSSEYIVRKCKALESTEHTIHRNIENALRKGNNASFEIGDRVLFRNPDIEKQAVSRKDPLAPRNLIGKITGYNAGGIYQVEVNDGREVYEKSLFRGQMVLFNDTMKERDVESAAPVEQRNAVDVKQLLDEVVDFAIDFRRDIYKDKQRKASKNYAVRNINGAFNDLCEALDCGLLSKLYSTRNLEKSEFFKKAYCEKTDQLKSVGFPYFMYGSVHWERMCRRHLNESLLEFLREFGEDEIQNHECIQCFSDDAVSCGHVCCRQKAIEFARRCGIPYLHKSVTLVTVDSKRKNQRKKGRKKSSTGKGRNKGTKRGATENMETGSPAKKVRVKRNGVNSDVAKSEDMKVKQSKQGRDSTKDDLPTVDPKVNPMVNKEKIDVSEKKTPN